MESQFHAFYQVSAQSIVDSAAAQKSQSTTGTTGTAGNTGSGASGSSNSYGSGNTFSEKSPSVSYTSSSNTSGKQ
ncbi:hypothetical protein SCUCBS95973_009619 [Sporothrix curviconia]|uniref:Uncharacterized protein n=1 Tax=Sporothrix curviconia TaxID=1260050 RepID=A0ABP0CWG0_9PEZI